MLLRLDHAALPVSEMIEAQGWRLIKGPLKIEGKVTWLYLADPDNSVIEFVQWLDR
jgi:hypothetical protein